MNKIGMLKRITLLSLLLLIAATYACQQQKVEKEDIENPKSSLLSSLLHEDDLSGDWVWIESYYLQKAKDPTSENFGLREVAGHTFDGLYGKNRIRIKFTHHLDLYEKDVSSWFPDHEINLPNSESKYINFDPGNIRVGNETKYECVWPVDKQIYTDMICQFVTPREKLVSTLIIFIPTEIDNETMNAIINDALERSEVRSR